MTDVLSFSSADGGEAGLLGGKGAGLAAMHGQGLNVPPGFIITTNAFTDFRRSQALGDVVLADMRVELAALERMRGRRLGDPESPLLLAIRSGAPVSMPGMMDTVLNLGINAETVRALAAQFGEQFAWDSYARFLESFGSIVLGVDAKYFKTARAAQDATDAVAVVDAYRRVIDTQFGTMPTDPRTQLVMAIEAVFKSWDNPRAAKYREFEGIADDLGTAVVVQAMVFGNLNDNSGTGVVFTRNPNTGDRIPYGDFLFRAQGEDVVSGNHTTLPLDALRQRLPDVWAELIERLEALEAWRSDMLDVEFTVEDGELFFLQVRSAKRSALAAVRVALALVREGRIDKREALRRVQPQQLEALSRPRLVAGQGIDHLVTGLPASPGLAIGSICLTTESVLDHVDRGGAAILVREETSPDDVHGMAMSEGILTAKGGLVSHAAVVARSLAVPAVVGADQIRIDLDTRSVRFADEVLHEGEVITIDGDTGIVARGSLSIEEPATAGEELVEFMAWIDELVPDAESTARLPDRLALAQQAITAMSAPARP
jgi:pyruvate,orthophosphate dikinase